MVDKYESVSVENSLSSNDIYSGISIQLYNENKMIIRSQYVLYVDLYDIMHLAFYYFILI
jgi:hypothetical protein